MNVKKVLHYVAKNEVDSNIMLHFMYFVFSLVILIFSSSQLYNEYTLLNIEFFVTYCIFWISFGVGFIFSTYRITSRIPNELFDTDAKYVVQKTILNVCYTIFYIVCIVSMGLRMFAGYSYLYVIPAMILIKIMIVHFSLVEIEKYLFTDEEYIRKYYICISNLLGTTPDRSKFPLHFKKYDDYMKEKYGDAENPNNSCVICLNDFERTDHIAVLQCDHIYHYECISGWFAKKPNCPVCRATVTDVV